MSSFKSEQRRLRHHGREFHFVAYEGRVANERRGETALPPMWFLMNEGHRTAVGPHLLGQGPESLDAMFVTWLEENVFSLPVPIPTEGLRPAHRLTRHGRSRRGTAG